MERRKDRRTIDTPGEYGVWPEYASRRPLYRMVWHGVESGVIPTGKRPIAQTGPTVPGAGVQTDNGKHRGREGKRRVG